MAKETKEKKMRFNLGDEKARQEFMKLVSENRQRLSISRIPPQTKKEFTEYAREFFSDDYGMLLKYVWDQFKEYQLFKERLLDMIDLIERVSMLEDKVKIIEAKLFKLEEEEVVTAIDGTPLYTKKSKR